MNIFAPIGWMTGGSFARLVATVLVGAAAGGYGAWQVQEWRWKANNLKETVARQKADIQAGIENAKETQRRLDRQKENQDAQVQELAAARGAAVRNAADADRLRDQNAGNAKQWRDALGDPTIGGQCAAAGDAIGVLTDVLGRADRRAGILASYADAARAAGLQCQRDYDALTAPP